ncbi:MAG: hypothetical protein PVI89_13715, partial [Desulfobacteraceae bacterium]
MAAVAGVVLSKAYDNAYLRSDISDLLITKITIPIYFAKTFALMIEKEKIMKKLNVLLIAGLVLLFTCGTALAYSYGTSNGGGTQTIAADELGPEGSPVAPVPEPTTMLLLG